MRTLVLLGFSCVIVLAFVGAWRDATQAQDDDDAREAARRYLDRQDQNDRSA